MSTYEYLECIFFCGEIRNKKFFGKKKKLSGTLYLSFGKPHTHTHIHTQELDSKVETFSQITQEQCV